MTYLVLSDKNRNFMKFNDDKKYFFEVRLLMNDNLPNILAKLNAYTLYNYIIYILLFIMILLIPLL